MSPLASRIRVLMCFGRQDQEPSSAEILSNAPRVVYPYNKPPNPKSKQKTEKKTKPRDRLLWLDYKPPCESVVTDDPTWSRAKPFPRVLTPELVATNLEARKAVEKYDRPLYVDYVGQYGRVVTDKPGAAAALPLWRVVDRRVVPEPDWRVTGGSRFRIRPKDY